MTRYEPKAPRPSRVREMAPTYGAGAESGAPAAYAVTMAERGRLVLPVDVRERLKIKAGDRLTLRVEADGTLRLQTAAVFARSLRGMFKDLAGGRSLVGELIAERRREAAREDRQDAEYVARTKKRARR